MPLKSKSQERYLWTTNPKVAQEFEDKTSKSQKKKLPEHVKQTRNSFSMPRGGRWKGKNVVTVNWEKKPG